MNQYIEINPQTIEVMEFEEFNQNFTITHNPPDGIIDSYDYELYTVNIDSDVPTWSTVTYTKLTNMSFNLTGVIGDVFDRNFKYISKDAIYGEVNRFSLLPDSYGGIFSYTSTTANQARFTMNVVMVPVNTPIDQLTTEQFHSYSLEIMVRNNWTVANSMLTEHVNKGCWI